MGLSMATPTELSNQFRADQIDLARESTTKLLEVSGALNFKAVDSSAPGWIAAVESIVVPAHERSVQLGAALYGDYRLASGVAGAAPVVIPELDRRALRNALTILGPYAAKHAMAQGMSISKTFENVFANTAGTAVKTVLGGGRDTVQGSSVSDTVCVGYQRVTSSSPCPFCAMVAQNTYRSVESASQSSGTRKRSANPQPPKSRYHSHCRCTVVPIFSAASWPAGYKSKASDWAELYGETSAAGGTAKEKEQRFMAAFTARYNAS